MPRKRILFSVAEVAEIESISPQRVRQLLSEGHYKNAEKISGSWVIPSIDIKPRPYNKGGRPRTVNLGD